MVKKEKSASKSWVREKLRKHAALGRKQITRAVKKRVKPGKRRKAVKRRKKRR